MHPSISLLVLRLIGLLLPILPAAAFDHSHTNFTTILTQHLRQEQVDYTQLKATPAPLNAYLDSLAQVPRTEFDAWTSDQQVAFLINLYNATTLQLVRDHYPVASIKDIGGWFDSPWKMRVVRVWGRKLTLDGLEHDVIRPTYHEPRIHFALVCAAKGCPPLRAEAFQGCHLNAQLDDQGRQFLHESAKNYYEPATRTLWLSPIFKWYAPDFGGADSAVIQYARKFLPEVPAAEVRLRYTTYDWKLNDSALP
jgi:hypothetical protein